MTRYLRCRAESFEAKALPPLHQSLTSILTLTSNWYLVLRVKQVNKHQTTLDTGVSCQCVAVVSTN